MYAILDVLEEIARACGVTVAQVAINWVMRRPAARLSQEETERLNHVSAIPLSYPYWGDNYLDASTGGGV